jgi:hypothetical protein
MAEFRCATWDEGEWRRGRSGDAFFVVVKKDSLNVYKRVILGQIRRNPSMDLCRDWFFAYIAPSF